MLCFQATGMRADDVTNSGVVYEINGSTATVKGYTADLAAEVTIPEKVNDVTVTAIGGKAFFDCAALQKITLPSTVTTIGDWAFMKNKNLKAINIPEQCTLGMGCFTSCPSLDDITLDGSDNKYVIDTEGGKLTKGVLYTKDKKSLVLFLPTNVIDKGGEPAQNPKLTIQWKVPNSVETICAGSLGENWLEHVVLPTNLKTIEPYAFYRHKDYSITTPANWRMAEVTVPKNVEALNMTAFLQEAGDGIKTKVQNLFITAAEQQYAVWKYKDDNDMTGWMEIQEGIVDKKDPLTGEDIDFGDNLNVYVTSNFFDTQMPEKDRNKYMGVAKIKTRIPLDTRLTAGKPITMCRDFDMDFSEQFGLTKAAYDYRALPFIAKGVSSEAGTEGYTFHPVSYVPSRTGENQDEYHGVVIALEAGTGTQPQELYYTIGTNSVPQYVDASGKNQSIELEDNRLVGVVAGSIVQAKGDDGVDQWGLSSDGKWYQLSYSGNLTPYNRAYLKPTAADNEKMKGFASASTDGKVTSYYHESGTTTGIKSLDDTHSPVAGDAWYTIGGQRLQGKPSAKGIYIIGGKKVVIQ